MNPAAWRTQALEHCLWLLAMAGKEYAIRAADDAEKASEGVLKGLGKRVRAEIEKQRQEALCAR